MFPANYTFYGPTGLSLKAALTTIVGGVATPDVANKDLAGVAEIGTSGLYIWSYASHPTGFRGFATFYTGNIGVATNFNSVSPYACAAVDPALENCDVSPNFIVEGDETIQNIMRYALAALTGKNGSFPTTFPGVISYRSLDGVTDRIIATVTQDGKRNSVVLNPN